MRTGRTRRAVDVVQDLLRQLVAPLGGPGSPRARAFVEELTTLLDVPLVPSPPDDTTAQGATP
ncbi:hypothetical protein [Streptomyces roseolus]|uniref:hypothetical protein n=1 Tax=Streptomyces roseolus TaxID=67358 RepID=UPI0036EE29F7